MPQPFAASQTSLEGPASGVFAVTPNNSVDLAIATRAIRATTAGNIVITGVDGVDCTCAFLAGETRPIRATRIKSTGTTCTGIEGMY